MAELANPATFKYRPDPSRTDEENAKRIITSLSNLLIRSSEYIVTLEFPTDQTLDPIEMNDLMLAAIKTHEKIMGTPELKELMDGDNDEA